MSAAERLHHQHALWLAAAALDFGIDEGEREELEGHLAACLACRRETVALRGDATRLRLPTPAPALVPSPWVDQAVYAEIARRRRAFEGVPVLVAATLMLVALLGVVTAGAFLLGIWPPRAEVPVPTPPVVVENPTPSPSGDASPLPTGKPLPAWTAVDGTLPAESGRVQMAPGPYGGLYVLVNDPSGALLALLDAAGEPREGWPTALPGWTCDSPSTSATWAPGVAADGSVRVVCYAWDAPEDPVFRAFAFDAEGRPMAGWPVALPPDSSYPPRVVGDVLVVAAHEVRTLETTRPDGQVVTSTPGAYWLVEVAPDGTTRAGARLDVDDASGGVVSIGPDGIGWLVDGGEITAFDMDGQRGGWPVEVDGNLSALAFGPSGAAYLTTVFSDGATTRLIAFDRDGVAVSLATGDLPIGGVSAWTGAGPEGGPLAPLVAPDGTTYVIGRSGADTVVYGLDASGAVMDGWPYRVTAEIPLQGECPPESAGCGVWRATPSVGPNGVLFLPLTPTEGHAGGTLVAVGTRGTLVPGWPVWLVKKGAAYWSVVAASTETAFALAVEPERGDTTSATILEFALDSVVRWKTTVVQP